MLCLVAGEAPGADEITFEVWRQMLPYIGLRLEKLYQTYMDLGYAPQS